MVKAILYSLFFIFLVIITARARDGNGVCNLPPEVGPCKALYPRYGFDTKTLKCEKFIYGGCKGNANNFETLEECEATCGS